jgi:hypothetical protein
VRGLPKDNMILAKLMVLLLGATVISLNGDYWMKDVVFIFIRADYASDFLRRRVIQHGIGHFGL